MALNYIRSELANDVENLATKIVNCAFRVHKYFGPGLTERIYEEAFCKALEDEKILFERQKPVHIFFEHHDLKLDYKLDLLVENEIVVELKCVENLLPLHKSQIMTYMRLVDKRLGFLINFNTLNIGQGIKRVIL